MIHYIVDGQTVDPNGNPVEVAEDLSKLSKAALQKRAEEQGLETTGTKDELVARLEEATKPAPKDEGNPQEDWEDENQ